HLPSSRRRDRLRGPRNRLHGSGAGTRTPLAPNRRLGAPHPRRALPPRLHRLGARHPLDSHMSIGQIIFLGVATAFVLFVAGLVTWTISADDSRRARI